MCLDVLLLKLTQRAAYVIHFSNLLLRMVVVSASLDISLLMEHALKFAETGGCLTLPVTTITMSMETVVHQTAPLKRDTNALMELPQPHQYVHSLENTLNFNSKA